MALAESAQSVSVVSRGDGGHFVRDIFCDTFRFGITALSFLFRKLLREIQQLFTGSSHDNRAQLVEGERSYFTPGAVYV